MPKLRKVLAALLALISFALFFAASPARAEKRIALVIGNASYQAGALTTPANDAGLIAQTLEAAGFDVAGARDLDQDSLRRAFRDFLEKAGNSGPDTLAFIYVSGYGLQLEGENYFVPVDAKIARDSDVAAEALRISDYTRPLAALKLKAAVVVVDAARANPFAKSGPPLAGGLALVEPEPGMLIAFNAAPGTVGPEAAGPYGAYAQALAEMLREGGLPLAAAFDRARLRANESTKAAEVPWQASKIESALVLFERTPDAPAPAVSAEQAGAIRSRPIRDLSAQEAYAAALDRDTLEGYLDFLAVYPDDPMAARVRAMVAARREALTWRRTRVVDTPPAYWSYLRRYPQGPHAADAHRRLAFLAAALEPPPSFAVLAYDLPPPPPDEIVYIRRPVLIFDDPVFAFAPPPPPPIIFLASRPPEFVVLPPPPPPVGIFVLPMPVYRPVPVWVRPPAYVAPPPPNNVIYRNVHNTVVVNNVTNTVTITNPSGQTRTVAPAAQPSAPPATAPGAAPAAPTHVLPGP
ncbi:MAG: caspase domain-containing protein, partial [Xanthobacteraceae bacterium]